MKDIKDRIDFGLHPNKIMREFLDSVVSPITTTDYPGKRPEEIIDVWIEQMVVKATGEQPVHDLTLCTTGTAYVRYLCRLYISHPSIDLRAIITEDSSAAMTNLSCLFSTYQDAWLNIDTIGKPMSLEEQKAKDLTLLFIVACRRCILASIRPYNIREN